MEQGQQNESSEKGQKSKSSDSDMFQKLVLGTDENSPERFVGMLAYVEWKLEIFKHPEVSDNFCTELHLKAYRGRAEELLKNYAVSVAEQELGKLLQDKEIPGELKVLETRLSQNVSQDLKAVESCLTKQMEENSKASFGKIPIPVWHSYIASWIFVVTFPIVGVLIWSAFDNGRWFKNCLDTLPKPSQVQQNTNQE
jgi:hypothetical protein